MKASCGISTLPNCFDLALPFFCFSNNFLFLSVAPPASDYDFSFLAPCPSSGLMLQGDSDENISSESVKKLVEKLSAQRAIEIQYRQVAGANHFFAGKIEEMMAEIDEYLDTQLPESFERSED